MPQDAAFAAALIRRHCPDIAAAHLEPLPHYGWGGDSDAFLVDGSLVFRFPRRPEVARALAVEACLLSQLTPSLPLPIPAITYLARDPATSLPLFVGYPAIPGLPLDPDRFSALHDSATHDHLAAQLGAFLTALHTFPTARALACGLTPIADSLHTQAQLRLASLRRAISPALTPHDLLAFDRFVAAYLADPRHFTWPPTLCHGDLNSDHLLAQPATHHSSLITHHVTLTGIIDFGDLQLADPATDFQWAAEYGEAFLTRVLAHYQSPTPDLAAFRRAIAFHARLVPAQQLAWGLQANDTDAVEQGRRLLRDALAASPTCG